MRKKQNKCTSHWDWRIPTCRWLWEANVPADSGAWRGSPLVGRSLGRCGFDVADRQTNKQAVIDIFPAWLSACGDKKTVEQGRSVEKCVLKDALMSHKWCSVPSCNNRIFYGLYGSYFKCILKVTSLCYAVDVKR